MARSSTGDATQQPRLSRDRVLRAAVALADSDGLAGLTIRSLAQSLGAKPMSVYHYVANKEEILDGIVDLVFSEIDVPVSDDDWRSQMQGRAHSARRALRAHPWAIGLMESRTRPGPATLRHHDAVIATLRGAGFSPDLTAHAYAVLDSYVYGFALQEAGLPFQGSGSPAEVPEVAGPIVEHFTTGEYPHLVQMTTDYYLQPGYDFGEEFAWGLDLILDALARRLG
jgi:AcrR family transcriptional regulator